MGGFNSQEGIAMWKKPAFIDMRLGLEVTLYISNR
ncbi:pyrroloquinoline quinone precursor peptide PqqA [Pantoea agglomerans]|nr:pyrroloquinoline quinone precursor peptide PqqA [Pantoea agglomerans]